MRSAIIFGLTAALVGVGLMLWDQASERRRIASSAGVKAELRGGADSISGHGAARRVHVDPEGHRATVEVASRYFDQNRALADNREHVATEGRLIIQLLFYDHPALTNVEVILLGPQGVIARVRGRSNQNLGEYAVLYQGALSMGN